MRHQALLIICFSLLALAFGAEARAQGVSAEDLERARQERVASGRYQLEVPPDKQFEQPSQSKRPSFEILQYFGYLILFAAAVALIVALVMLLTERSRKRASWPAKAEAERVVLSNVEIEVDMAAIEELAAAGRYSEAIHLLLLRTITELIRLARVSIKKAWTSREIVRSIPLEGAVRGELQSLVRSAELAHFAAVEAAETDYREARATFDRLVAGLKGRPA